MNWVGLTVESFTIEEQLGEGSFAWVYRGTNPKDKGDRKAFKVAKPTELVGDRGTTGVYHTRALRHRTNGVENIHPDGSELLRLQWQKLQRSNDPALVAYEGLFSRGPFSYCRMEYVEGRTLRELIDSGTTEDADKAIESLVEIAVAMDRLIVEGFNWHGDLTPDNIMVTNTGVKLLDPGYFGPLTCEEGLIPDAIVTTPMYYPLLQPDDVMALGLILWEIVLQESLLDPPPGNTASKASAELRRWIERQEMLGKFFTTPLLTTRLPSEIHPDVDAATEKLLLKSVRLGLNNQNRLEREAGFKSFKEFIDALKASGLLPSKEASV